MTTTTAASHLTGPEIQALTSVGDAGQAARGAAAWIQAMLEQVDDLNDEQRREARLAIDALLNASDRCLYFRMSIGGISPAQVYAERAQRS